MAFFKLVHWNLQLLVSWKTNSFAVRHFPRVAFWAAGRPTVKPTAFLSLLVHVHTLTGERKQDQFSRRSESASEHVCTDSSPSALFSRTGGKGGPH